MPDDIILATQRLNQLADTLASIYRGNIIAESIAEEIRNLAKTINQEKKTP